MKRIDTQTTSDALQQIGPMFAADRSMTEGEWYELFPPYQGDSGLGAKVWWNPLSLVWRLQGQPDENFAGEDWTEEWTFLQRLHAEYLRA